MLDGIEILYTKTANGSSNANHNGQKYIIDRKNFVDRALKDLKIVSKHAQNIKFANNTKYRRNIVSSLIEFFKTQKCVHVKEIGLHKFSFEQVLTILPCFDAKQLKNIDLSGIKSIYQFERITDLKQWQNAEELRIFIPFSKISSTIIVHLFHFQCFSIHYVGKVSVQTAIQMREDLLRRSTFQSCEITFEKSKSNPIELAKVFKLDYAGGNEFKIEFSNCNNKFDISLKEFSWCFVLNVERL
ncbi:DUF38 domain-containing protein [Caenorhabditis elegans]|uniref:DUF38 domain-containing protein n=1 Tax=Caenorhabditis elegans TaxID=6239 RepID=Q19168_CAEEL|nr:DUF38 domain-containing protein [Caenorhabditis elegans]CCD66889.2 DUF38 domain-containing protein [Caenorhabditis elegans]